MKRPRIVILLTPEGISTVVTDLESGLDVIVIQTEPDHLESENPNYLDDRKIAGDVIDIPCIINGDSSNIDQEYVDDVFHRYQKFLVQRNTIMVEP